MPALPFRGGPRVLHEDLCGEIIFRREIWQRSQCDYNMLDAMNERTGSRDRGEVTRERVILKTESRGVPRTLLHGTHREALSQSLYEKIAVKGILELKI